MAINTGTGRLVRDDAAPGVPIPHHFPTTVQYISHFTSPFMNPVLAGIAKVEALLKYRSERPTTSWERWKSRTKIRIRWKPTADDAVGKQPVLPYCRTAVLPY